MIRFESANKQTKGNTMKTIQIKIPDGEVTIPAYVRGIFAVHKTYYDDGSLKIPWSITHIPTGFRVVQGIETRQLALDTLKDILPLIPKDCAFYTSTDAGKITSDKACILAATAMIKGKNRSSWWNSEQREYDGYLEQLRTYHLNSEVSA